MDWILLQVIWYSTKIGPFVNCLRRNYLYSSRLTWSQRISETAMGTRLGSQTHQNSDYIDAVYRLSQIAWDYIRYNYYLHWLSNIFLSFRFPWLWYKPIWAISGYANEFNQKCAIAQNFTRRVSHLDEISYRTSSDVGDRAEKGGARGGRIVGGRIQWRTGMFLWILLFRFYAWYLQVKTKKLALLDLLLMMQKANALSDEDLRAEVDTFMFEG